MITDLSAFLYGVLFGAGVSFASCFVACMAYSRITGLPSPTGHIPVPQALPFIVKDENAEARIEREAVELFARDQVPGIGR